jgi:hypothetical protein
MRAESSTSAPNRECRFDRPSPAAAITPRCRSSALCSAYATRELVLRKGARGACLPGRPAPGFDWPASHRREIVVVGPSRPDHLRPRSDGVRSGGCALHASRSAAPSLKRPFTGPLPLRSSTSSATQDSADFCIVAQAATSGRLLVREALTRKQQSFPRRCGVPPVSRTREGFGRNTGHSNLCERTQFQRGAHI